MISKTSKTAMKHEIVATATYFAHPREYLVKLYQFKPRTFTWMSGSFRLPTVPNFRNADDAIAFAQSSGWVVTVK